MAYTNTLGNRVKETTTTTGTGNLTLAGAATNFQTFNNAFGTDVHFHYLLVDDTNNVWETGRGYLSASTTLVRDQVHDNSSGTTSALNLSAGTKDVLVAPTTHTTFAAPPFYNANGRIFSEHLVNSSTVNKSLSSNRAYFVPFKITAPDVGISSIKCTISTALAGSGRMGIYAPTQDPGAFDTIGGRLIAEGTATFDTSTTGEKSVTLSPAVNISPGWYWLALIASAAIEVKAYNTPSSSQFCPLTPGNSSAAAGTHVYANQGSTTLPASFSVTSTQTSVFPLLSLDT